MLLKYFTYVITASFDDFTNIPLHTVSKAFLNKPIMTTVSCPVGLVTLLVIKFTNDLAIQRCHTTAATYKYL
jgi:hypothetical protein